MVRCYLRPKHSEKTAFAQTQNATGRSRQPIICHRTTLIATSEDFPRRACPCGKRDRWTVDKVLHLRFFDPGLPLSFRATLQCRAASPECATSVPIEFLAVIPSALAA